MEFNTQLKYKDVILDIEGHYYEGEEQTRNYIGSPDTYEIDNVYINFINVNELLENQLEDIEELILNQIRNKK